MSNFVPLLLFLFWKCWEILTMFLITGVVFFVKIHLTSSISRIWNSKIFRLYLNPIKIFSFCQITNSNVDDRTKTYLLIYIKWRTFYNRYQNNSVDQSMSQPVIRSNWFLDQIKSFSLDQNSMSKCPKRYFFVLIQTWEQFNATT